MENQIYICDRILIEELSNYENEIQLVDCFYIEGIKKYFIYKIFHSKFDKWA